MATRYYQCSKCKRLLSFSDILKTAAQITVLVKCHDRRMRELTDSGGITGKDKYDHEVIQRDYIDGKGPAPSETVLMERLNA